MLYGIDISDHQAGTRPDKICPTCYQRLMSSKNTGKDGKMNLSGMYAKQKDIVQGIASMWKEHDDNDCKICTHYEEQSQPLRKRPKTVSPGRPSLKHNKLPFIYSPSSIVDALFNEENITLDNCQFLD